MSDHEARATIQPAEDATAQRVDARSGQKADTSASGSVERLEGGQSVEQRAVTEAPPAPPRFRHAVEVSWSSQPVSLLREPDPEEAPSEGDEPGAQSEAGEPRRGEDATADVPIERREPSQETKAARAAVSKKPPSPAPRRMTWRPGMVIGGRYHLRHNLGVGGTGLVVVADDLLLRKPVAVKALRPSVARDPENVERFRKEVAVCHAVTHPNIVRTYDIGEEEGVHYFSMEYLEGRPLSDHLKERLVLPPGEVRRLFIPVCRALEAAHDALIVHRDLKPSNIMLVPAPRRVVVMDFGISGLVDEPAPLPLAADDPSGPLYASNPSRPRSSDWDVTSAGWGTPKYMSPEQWSGARTGPTSDIYSLGAIMFQCLTGRPPFLADDDRTFAALHLKKEAPRIRDFKPELPRDLDHLVARCLEKQPSERFPTAAALADALAGKQRLPKWVRFAVRAVGLALVMALFGWAVIAVSNRAIIREMRPAVQRLAELTAQNVAITDLDAIHAPEDYARPEFERVRAYFQAVAAENPEAHFIYTLRAREGEGLWEFVVDKDPFPTDLDQDGDIEEGDEQGAMPGQGYIAPHLDAMTEALARGRPTADDDFVWDTYGLFLSGYAPIGDERGTGGYVLGVDVSNRRLLVFNRIVMGFCVVAWLLLLFAPQLLRLARRRWRRDLRVLREAAAE